MFRRLLFLWFLFASSIHLAAQDTDMMLISLTQPWIKGETGNLKITLKSEQFKSYHRLQMNWPTGFIFEPIAEADVIFQQDVHGVKILWTTSSSTKGNEISFNVQPSSTLIGAFRIPLEFHYLDNLQKKILKLSSLEIKIMDQKTASSPEAKLIRFPLNSSVLNQSSSNQNVKSEFRIQLFKTQDALNNNWVAQQFKLKEEDIMEEIFDGYYLYTIGNFANATQARTFLEKTETIKNHGFVLEFNQGKPIFK